jgi:hypothetical protein
MGKKTKLTLVSSRIYQNRANYFSKTPYKKLSKVFFANSFAGNQNVDISETQQQQQQQQNTGNRANYFSKTPYLTFCKVFFAKSFAGIQNVRIF